MAYNKLFYYSRDDNAYITNIPSLPGCMADGTTIEESLQNADTAITEWISLAKELKRKIPKEDPDKIISTNPSATDTAAYILDRLIELYPWKLQYLVYYCQAWCLGLYKTRFIDDWFTAYYETPVNRELTALARGKYIVTKNSIPLTHAFSNSEKRHMDSIIKTYGNEDEDTIRQYICHEKPWTDTENPDTDKSAYQAITDTTMMEYYHN